ncbi:VanW family protein [Neobacillus drentensis]|uniref:VanW family protein n=1 Tax=Neobacillus drentensis TaxID=220684 RepID=UPI00285F0BD9|nr:VanW family protein [Neobacillus drentensis]MDR7240242.1 vancomycin resistance protein YoaR [Neobacillus drentensis]
MIFSLIMGYFLLTQPSTASTDHLIITKDGQTVTIVNREEFTFPQTGLPLINSRKYRSFLDKLDNQFSVAPENASLDPNGMIIPERTGSRIHRQAFTEQFYSYFFSPEKAKMEIPILKVYPKVDSELLSDIRSMRIGRYVTSFNPQNKKRSNNIQLATKAINNHVVFPGETFSFNKVVGKRTVAKGYLRAPVIVRGEFSEDIGGGICQVSSTLYNAVDNAGVKIVERFSHSRKVPYIPPGRDATVSWYGPDFEFKNNYNQPILIRARTLGHLLIIRVYSSENINYLPRKVPYLPY